MDQSIIFALSSAVFIGLHSFFSKTVAEKKYNVALLSIYTYSFSAAVGFVYLLLSGQSIIASKLTLMFAVLTGLLSASNFLTRIAGLRNIDAVIFFPLFKTIGPIFITLISFLVFQESLSPKELLGVAIGICVPFLLITKSEGALQKNLKKGVFFVCVNVFIVILASSTMKYANINLESLLLYIPYALLFGAFFSAVLYRFLPHGEDHVTERSRHFYTIAVLLSLLHLGAFSCFSLSLAGNFAVSYTLNSFSFLIPIFLSLMIYKEHLNARKIIVIVLSVFSVLLFI